MDNTNAREPNGRFAEQTFVAVYDSLDREIRRIDGNLAHEIERINDLRAADQAALVSALVSAKAAVEAALAAAEKAVAAALVAAKEAVTKAETAQGKTNEGQNEFRAQLRDQAATFLPKAEAQLLHNALEARLDILQAEAQNRLGRNSGVAATWSTIIAVAGVSAAIGGTIIGLILQ